MRPPERTCDICAATITSSIGCAATQRKLYCPACAAKRSRRRRHLIRLLGVLPSTKAFDPDYDIDHGAKERQSQREYQQYLDFKRTHG